jgi:hypothetical protein
VDETQHSNEVPAMPEQPDVSPVAEAPAQAETPSSPSAGADTLQAFIAGGGTFGMAIRDTLAQAQLDPTGAAKMSGEHIANLLYGTTAVDQHTAPYTGRAYLNPNDYRDRDTNATPRRRQR